VKWEEPDASALAKRPTGQDLDSKDGEAVGAEVSSTIRPSPCFTAVPRGKRAAELFSDKESIPPVGFYNPKESFVTPKTNISTKFLYPKACEPRTPLTREQIHAQYPLSRPSSAAGNYSSRAVTPAKLNSTLPTEAAPDDSKLDATAAEATLTESAQSHAAADGQTSRAKSAQSRSRSPSPCGSWFFNKSDRIICAEPMYRTAIAPKEDYDVDKGWAMMERKAPGVSLKVVGRDDRTTETFDRIYPGAWAVKRRVASLSIAKTTGRDRPASGSSLPRPLISSVDYVESLPYTSERARPSSVDLKRMTGRNAPVISKTTATPASLDAVYNPQINFVRQRMTTPVPFAKIPGRSPPRHFSSADDDGPLVYDSLSGFEYVAPRTKSPGKTEVTLPPIFHLTLCRSAYVAISASTLHRQRHR